MKQIPSGIRSLISGKQYKIDTVGMSDSKVMLFDDMVLKIQPDNKEAANEYTIMKWLAGEKLVPDVLAYEARDGKAYLLMTKMQGRMSCDERYMKDPELLMQILADGLKRLWSIDVSECPCCNCLDVKLQQAAYYVENGLVDLENTEPETFSEGGFENPDALLQWLYDNRPDEEPVLSHGDYCLPNVFADGDRFCGLVDLVRMGTADKWQDIALAYRSLKHNYEGRFGGGSYGDLDHSILFKKLGIGPDWEKIRYYILLDELF